MTRFRAAGTLAAFTAVALPTAAACVDPKTDYEDFLARTADANTTPVTGDGSPSLDGNLGADAAGFTQQYVMACVSESANDSVTEATYFSATATFKPAASGGGGTFDFTDNALQVGATDISQTAGGQPYTVNGSVVSADGRCDVVFPATTIPGSGDPVIPGQDIQFAYSTLHFVIGPGTNLCANLSGKVTAPILVDMLDPTKNVCVFFPSTGAVPTLTQDDLTQAEVLCP